MQQVRRFTAPPTPGRLGIPPQRPANLGGSSVVPPMATSCSQPVQRSSSPTIPKTHGIKLPTPTFGAAHALPQQMEAGCSSPVAESSFQQTQAPIGVTPLGPALRGERQLPQPMALLSFSQDRSQPIITSPAKSRFRQIRESRGGRRICRNAWAGHVQLFPPMEPNWRRRPRMRASGVLGYTFQRTGVLPGTQHQHRKHDGVPWIFHRMAQCS